MKRQEKRRHDRELNKITQLQFHSVVPYTDNKRVFTRAEEREIEDLIEERNPFKEVKELLTPVY